jgi:hypothetical protein
MFNRRKLLTNSTALIGFSTVLILAACNGQTAASVTQVAATYVADIANGVAAVFAALPPGSNTITAVQSVASEIGSLAGQISTSVAQNAAQPIITQIQSDFNSFVTSLGTVFSGNASVSQILSDIKETLPLAEAALGIVLAVGISSAVTASQQAAAARLHSLARAKAIPQK